MNSITVATYCGTIARSNFLWLQTKFDRDILDVSKKEGMRNSEDPNGTSGI